MSKLEFLSPRQWEHLEALSADLTSEQAIWIGGYLVGIAHAVRDGAAPVAVPAAPAAVAARTLTVLFGSETGNSATLARTLAEAARARGIPAEVADMADYKPRSLRDEQDLLVVTSTYGEGDPPQTAVGFFEFLEGRKAPKLAGMRFAVLGLGDSTYEHYCAAAARVDRRLAELGAERLAERVDCDVDFEDAAAAWVEAMVARLAPETAAAAPVPAAAAAPAAVEAAAFDRKHPFHAPILDNVVLTGRGSSKETRHVELSLEGSGIAYRPGDALGVVPRNDPGLVATLLDALGLDPAAEVTLRQRQTTLGAALTEDLEITAATPRFLDHWAAVSGAAELGALAADGGEVRTAFLRGHHVLDIVERFPVAGLDAGTFVAGLRPLQPRLYSIASSLEAAPDEVHLTVSTVRYDLHGRVRTGVASGFLAGLGDEATVPVYVQPSAHFHLADDDTPIIMIGAGTGVAPFRAFMQEREARGAGGRSWLFFGERNFRSDFLYQVEWQEMLASGVLSRMDVAFSRDGAGKVYVQDRLRRQGRDVHAWLEEGASLYVCGDASAMAPDVQAALIDIVAEHGGLGREEAGAYVAELQRDRRYLLDVY